MQKRSLLSTAFLVGGYTVGTGFFDIPSTSGPTGFFPGALIGFVTWAFLMCTAFLFLEAILICPQDASVMTVCTYLIGPIMGLFTSIVFWGMNCFFIADYYNTTVGFIHDFLFLQFTISIQDEYFYLLLFALFFLTVYVGSFFSERVNYVLFVSMLICGIVAYFVGIKIVHLKSFLEKDWYYVFFAIPIILTAYNFQSIIPTVSANLEKNPKKIAWAIVIGTTIPLVFFNLWQWVVISSTTRDQLWLAFEIDYFEISAMKIVKENVIFRVFFYSMTFLASLCAVIASGLALFDFFSDAFRIPREKRIGWTRFYLCLVTFLPPLLIIWFFPSLFEHYPTFIVGFSEVFFVGVIPIWLSIKARYVKKLSTIQFVPFGKISLTILALMTFFLFYLEGIQFFRRV